MGQIAVGLNIILIHARYRVQSNNACHACLGKAALKDKLKGSE
jgi:hypothetical protein